MPERSGVELHRSFYQAFNARDVAGLIALCDPSIVEIDAYFDLGEHVLAFDALHGRGRQSGAEVTLPSAAVTRWRSGQCVYFKAYADREEALRDLGVSEDALESIFVREL